MYLTQDIQLTLYTEITAEAKRSGYLLHLQHCDVEDIISNAYLKAREKLARHEGEWNRAFINSIAYSEVLRELGKRKTGSERRWQTAYRLDAPVDDDTDVADNGDDNTNEFEGEFLNDNGKGEADIVSFDEPLEPDYVYLTRAQEAKESGYCKKIMLQLKKTWSYREAAKKCLLSRRGFRIYLKKLRIHFALCLCAYHEHLEKNERTKK